MQLFKRGIRQVVDLLFPVWCAACGKEGEWWCDACAKPERKYIVFSDGVLISITALFAYDETKPSGRLIRQFKYHQAHGLREVWNREVVVSGEVYGGATLIPVPLWPRRERERGYNQAEIIAQALAKKYHLPIVRDLQRVRATDQQAKLNREERIKNVRDAFVWKSGQSAPKKVLLVDDVFTTGSTMQACARELFKAGAEEVSGFVLARD